MRGLQPGATPSADGAFDTDDLKFMSPVNSTAAVTPLTLKGAVDVAAVGNRQIKMDDSDVGRLRWDYRIKQSERLPNVRFLGYGALQTIESPLIPAKADAFIFGHALMPITQQFRLTLEGKIVKSAQVVAFEKLRLQRHETRAKVQAAYYKLALDSSLTRDAEDLIRYLKQLQVVIAEQVKNGSSLKVDALEVNARLAKAEFDLKKLRNTQQIDAERFNQLLGRDIATPTALTGVDAAQPMQIDLSAAESTALLQRPELKIAQERFKQIQLEKMVIRSRYLPDISAGVVWGTLPGFNISVLPNHFLAPGLFFTWNAFDWGRKEMEVKARNLAAKSATLTLAEAKADALIDVHTQIHHLNEARDLIDVTRLGREAAREKLRVYLNRYKFTAAKLSEVLEAESQLSNSNNSYHEALLAFWEARAQYERAMGKDD